MKSNTKHLATTGILPSLISTPIFAADANKKILSQSLERGICTFDSTEQCRGHAGSQRLVYGAGRNWSMGRPENGLAYSGGHVTRRERPQAEKDLDELHKKNMSTKGVGAQ